MWVRAIRLLNVKSFAEGPQGHGWRIEFDRGLNRLAGPNGVGKTTVIEALGHALFDASPDLGARMDLDSALLRHGASEGEIEVELATAEGVYRVRRGVGKRSKLRWTVSDASGFVTHETEPQVRRFLATSAGLSNPDGLTDLFNKLLGIRQGRQLDPFERTPAEARRHFAPLLNVEIYQRCFAELMEPAQRLKEAALETEGRVRTAKGQAELLAGSAEEAARLLQRVAETEPRLDRAREELNRARQTLDAHDEKAQAIPASDAALKQARLEVESAESALLLRRELLQRAEQAHGVLQQQARAHEAFVAAEKELADIAARRPALEAERERLEEIQRSYVRMDTQARETQKRAEALAEELKPELEEFARRQHVLDERKTAFETRLAQPLPPHEAPLDGALELALAAVERWASSLAAAAEGARHAGALAAAANTALTSFDPDRNRMAKAEKDAADAALAQIRDRLTELEAMRRSRRDMGRQLQATKVCPLLNATCRQFDPGRLVLSEVNLDRALEEARSQKTAAEAVAAKAAEAAARAEEDENNTRDVRVRVDMVLTEIQRHLALAGDEAGRAGFECLALALVPAGTEPLRLPDPPRLPDPAQEPWDALAAAPSVAEGFRAFAQTVATAASQWRAAWTERQEAAADRLHRQHLERQQLAQEAATLSERRASLDKRRAQIALLEKSALESRARAKACEAEIAELASRQSELTALAVRSRELEQIRSASANGHHLYLAAQADAARLEQARADVALAVGRLEETRTAAREALARREAALATYDREAHTQARLALEESVQRVSRLETELQRDRAQLEDARQRAERLAAAVRELAEQDARLKLIEARRTLLDEARKALRDAGPRVAEQLVLAVNARAQPLYTALSPQDPGRLEWQADYELRVMTGSGMRRFANLSGGQRLKAALALHLALVQQFSRAGFCIFDEPTYGLDAASREKLAEALMEVRRLAGFEQLLVVSHDDAFDEHAEHTVTLSYSPATGSRVE